MPRAEAREVTRIILAFVKAWVNTDQKSTVLLEDDIERLLSEGFGR